MALVRGKALGDGARKATRRAANSKPKPACCEELAAGLDSADAAGSQ